MSSSFTPLPTPEGPGSVSDAPNLEFLAPYREDGGGLR
jgi:hypothetical protein